MNAHTLRITSTRECWALGMTGSHRGDGEVSRRNEGLVGGEGEGEGEGAAAPDASEHGEGELGGRAGHYVGCDVCLNGSRDGMGRMRRMRWMGGW